MVRKLRTLVALTLITVIFGCGFEFSNGQVEEPLYGGSIAAQIALDLAREPQVVGINRYSKKATPAFDLNITKCLTGLEPEITQPSDTVGSGGISTRSADGSHPHPLPCSNTSTTVVSSKQVITIQVKFDSPVERFPFDALTVENGKVLADIESYPSAQTSVTTNPGEASTPSSSSSGSTSTTLPCDKFPCPYLEGSLTVFDVLVELGPPDTVTSLYIKAGAVTEELGLETVASNRLQIIYDQQGPRPKITQLTNRKINGRSAAVAVIDFGERVLGDPRTLFSYSAVNATGSSEQYNEMPPLHIVYDVMYGRIYLVWEVESRKRPFIVDVQVPRGVTTDLVGHPNQEAVLQLVHYPEDTTAAKYGKALGVFWHVGTALSAVGAVTGTTPVTALLRGVHHAQTFYWLGQLAMPSSMPANFYSTSNELKFITLDYDFYSTSSHPSSNPTTLDQLIQGQSQFRNDLTAIVTNTAGKATILSGPQASQILSPTPIPGGLPDGLPDSDSASNPLIANLPQIIGSFCTTAAECPKKAVCTPQFASDGLARCRTKAWVKSTAKARLNGITPTVVLPYSPAPISPAAGDTLDSSNTAPPLAESESTNGSGEGDASDTEDTEVDTDATPASPKPKPPSNDNTDGTSSSPLPPSSQDDDGTDSSSGSSPSSPSDGSAGGGGASPPSTDDNNNGGVSSAPTPTPSTDPSTACTAPDQAIFVDNEFVQCTECAPARPYFFTNANSEPTVACYPGCPEESGPMPWFDENQNFKGCYSGCDGNTKPHFEAQIFLGCANCPNDNEPVFLKDAEYYCVAGARMNEVQATLGQPSSAAADIKDSLGSDGGALQVNNRRKLMGLLHGTGQYVHDDSSPRDAEAIEGRQQLVESSNSRRGLRSTERLRTISSQFRDPLHRRGALESSDSVETQIDTAGRLLVVATITAAQHSANGNTSGAENGEGDVQSRMSTMLDEDADIVADKVVGIVESLQYEFNHQSSDDMQPFWNTFFWCFIIMLCVFCLHIVLRALILRRRNKIPLGLLYPFAQVATFIVLLPILAAAAAVHLRSDGASFVVCFIFAFFLPALCIVCAFYLVLHYVALPRAGERAADYVVGSARNTKLAVEEHRQSFGIYYSTLSAYSSRESVPGEYEPQEVQKTATWLERYILGPIFGYTPSKSGSWIDKSQFEHSFIAKWGLLFSENKGPPVLHVAGTYRMNYRTGTLDRGKLVSMVTSRSQRMVAIAQVLGTVILLIKVFWFADMLAAFSDDGSDALGPLIFLLVLTTFYLAYLRLLSPLTRASLQVLDMLCTTCDLVTLSCAIAAVTAQPSSESYLEGIGLVMIIAQSFALLAEYVMCGWEVIRYAASMMKISITRLSSSWKKKKATASSLAGDMPTTSSTAPPVASTASPSDKFAQAVLKVMTTDPYLVARKFADRWMVKALKKGLHKRKLLAWERGFAVLPRVRVPRLKQLLPPWKLPWRSEFSPSSPRRYQGQQGNSPMSTAGRIKTKGSAYHSRRSSQSNTPSPRTPSSPTNPPFFMNNTLYVV